MQEVPPLGGDLPVDLAGQRLAPGPLGAGQLGRRLADMARVADRLACRERGEIFSPRSMPTSPVPAGRSSATSQTRLRYQRPVASSLKLPERMSAGIGRDSQRR
jgi:hypothetical protein